MFVLQTLLLLVLCPTSVTAIEKVDAGGILHSTGDIRVGQSVAAVIAIILGAIVCVLGYKLLRPAIFLCGFVSGGLLVALIIEYAFASMTWVATASWIGFLIGGVIVGCLVLMLYNVGLFLIGALAGTLLAFVLNTSFGYRIYPSQPDVMLVIMIIVLALVGGFLVWKLEKPVVILATSFIGATALIWGIGYFAGNYPSGADLKRFRNKDSQGDWIYDIPDAWWAYLCATLLIFLFGVYWQFTQSAKGVNHPRPAQNTTTRHSINDDYQHVAGTPISHV
uniref:Transmembrane protein 198 n=1 Tax=Globisporangium ultimum (strain ATCC 200006 / CBS 805.95 / DAOM BR144) TaxID=431595 RepID=K3WC45_GLOUD